MDSKTLSVLEYPKILARLADFCDFSGSSDLARGLTPTPDFNEASTRLAETSEARTLLVTSDLSIGSAHDIREQVDLAAHGGVLDPKELLDVQSTLISMRSLRRFFEKHAEASPHLAEIAVRLPAPTGLIEAIARCITEAAEVADSASPKLYDLRRQVRISHDRLMTRLQRYLTDASTASKLQDSVITQRDGRYVIPLRAEFKGQVKAIVHDQILHRGDPVRRAAGGGGTQQCLARSPGRRTGRNPPGAGRTFSAGWGAGRGNRSRGGGAGRARPGICQGQIRG